MIGSVRFVQSKVPGATATGDDLAPGALVVAVALDHRPVGALVFADELWTGVRKLLLDLKDFGLSRIVLVTGDRRDVAKALPQICRSMPSGRN
jgi:P-type E1-E2 ATPase